MNGGINMAVSGEMYLGDSELNSFFNNKITPWIKNKELELLKICNSDNFRYESYNVHVF